MYNVFMHLYIYFTNTQYILFNLLLQPVIDEGTIRLITTNYMIEFPDSQCSDKSSLSEQVTIRANSPAQYVMQNAADQFGSSYRFSATYFGSELGYFINTLNGVSSENNCFWIYFIGLPDGSESKATLGISSYRVPADDYSIIWRFMQTEPEEPSEMPDNAIVSCMMPMIIMCIHTTKYNIFTEL